LRYKELSVKVDRLENEIKDTRIYKSILDKKINKKWDLKLTLQ
jgi:hypothetical protein